MTAATFPSGSESAAPAVAAPVTDTEASLRRLDSGKRLLKAGFNVLLSVVVILVAWQVLVGGFHLDAFTTRTPSQVWKFLTASQNDLQRHQLIVAFKTTARDAALGMFAGTVAAVVLALLFNRWRAVESSVMPIAMAFRAVPLIAMTPVITLIFDRGLLCITVISGIVTFFPTLINVSNALRMVPAPSIDVMRAYGASKGTTLRKVQLPSALPSLFASIRIAAPLALVGALLAEYLATGKGLGYLMLEAQFGSDYDMVWAGAAVTTFTAVFLYGLVASLEQVVLTRFSDDPGRAGR